MTRTGPALPAIALLAAGAIGGWFLRSVIVRADSAAHEDAAAIHVEPVDMSVEVETALVSVGDVSLTMTSVGAVRADEGAVVTGASRAGGVVVEVLVHPGDEVAAGDPLVRFDRTPFELAVAQARAVAVGAENQLTEFDRIVRARQASELEAAARQAAAAAALASAQLVRTTALHRDRLASDKSLAEATESARRLDRERDLAAQSFESLRTVGAELQSSTLTATRDAAQSALRDAEFVLAQTIVRAAAAGRVLSIAIGPGEHAAAGAPLLALLVGDARVLSFGVTPSQAAMIRAGAPVTWVDSSQAPHTASVRSISAEVDPRLGLFQVLAVPARGEPSPAPGLMLRAEIETRRLTSVLLVPSPAVVMSEGRPTVVVAQKSWLVAKRVPVEVLGRHGGVTAVVGDLAVGDRVIVAGAYNLPDGAGLREMSSPPAPGHTK